MNSEAVMAQPQPGEQLNLTRLAIIIGVLAGIFGLVGAWFILPYRMEQAEKNISEMQAVQHQQQEVLIRIDENVKELRRVQRTNP